MSTPRRYLGLGKQTQNTYAEPVEVRAMRLLIILNSRNSVFPLLLKSFWSNIVSFQISY
ncbi:MAG: hypothetical protein HN736_10850 [Anaerolineae bacterium]|nr:hypothetical protein [Anaerolineae bacterium]MBT3712075.1 hypothetical protein [Anaerolineae bacterium]MBT4310157.1 hypothetical protein [Anaerolineae bacterium]MBT4457429.1 hypothetical protein [Anaerolineae bacterium]MBT6062554.1 hypothetical protein [Anaerolineae bacterium]